MALTTFLSCLGGSAQKQTPSMRKASFLSCLGGSARIVG